MNTYFEQALFFLMKTVIDVCFFFFLLRFMFHILRIDFYNPFSQFIFKVTNPILIPLRRVIPPHPKVDFGAFLILIFLKAFEFTITCLLKLHAAPSMLSLLIWPIGELISQMINVFFFAILLLVLQSWLNPKNFNPLTTVLIQLTEPVLAPAKKLVPTIAGIDVSPMIAIVILKLLDILLAGPIIQFGASWSY